MVREGSPWYERKGFDVGRAEQDRKRILFASSSRNYALIVSAVDIVKFYYVYSIEVGLRKRLILLKKFAK